MAHANVWLTCTLASAAFIAHAQGTVWRCAEPDGRPHYTNLKKETDGRNCVVVTKEISVMPAAAQKPAAAAASPANFPKVDKDSQKSRDEGRRKILEEELAAEEKSLADAKTKLGEQEAIRLGDEKNYQRVLDRLKPFQDAVERHERNVSALKKELASLR
jgi:hypothetical protein